MATSKRKVKQGARNAWDMQQRAVLCLLYAAQYMSKERTRIFNYIFQAHLASCGFSNGMKSSAIAMQYYESTQPRSVKHWKKPMAIAEAPERDRERQDIQARIDEAVEALSGLSISATTNPTYKVSSSTSTFFNAGSAPQTQATSTCQWRRPPPGPHPTTAFLPHVPAAGPARSNPISRCDTPPPLPRDFTSEAEPETPTPRRRQTLESVLVTALPHSSRKSALKPTSRSMRRSKMVQQDKIVYRQTTGRSINLSPQQLQKIQNARLVPVTQDAAHPPLAGLLFRYFDENSQGQNGNNGFTAGRFARINGPRKAAPLSEQVDSTDVENHLNRNPVASPFISTSDNLIWLLRLAMKETEKGAKKGCVAVIDTRQLKKQRVYWAKPYHAQLHDYFVFTDGAWRYPGTHEFLVWDQIPKHSIVKIFSVDRLFDSAAAHGSLDELLALELLASTNKSLKTKLMPQLKARNVLLARHDTVDAIAALAAFFGLGVYWSSYKHIEHFVHELVLGWGLQVTHQTFEQWASCATFFVESLSRYAKTADKAVTRFERKEKMKVAFLYGVRNALVGNWNVLFSPQRDSSLRKMHKATQAVNLQDPPAIIRLALQIAVQNTLDSLNVYGAIQDDTYGSPLTIRTTSPLTPAAAAAAAAAPTVANGGRLGQYVYRSGGADSRAIARSTRDVMEVDDDYVHVNEPKDMEREDEVEDEGEDWCLVRC